MNKNRDEKKTSNCDCLTNATRGWVAKAPFYSHVPTDIMLGFAGKTKKRHMRTKSRKLPMLVKLARFIFSLIGDLYIPLAIQLSNGLALVSRLEVVQDSK